VHGDALVLFGLTGSRPFAEGVAKALGIPLTEHEERDFEDGEHKIRPLQSVRGKDTYLLQSLHSDARSSVNDKLVRLLFAIGCLKDSAAGRITVLAPYLAYARKDRRTQPRDPVTIRYLAQMLESVGMDRLVTLEVHNLAAFQNAFRCGTEHLMPDGLFVDGLLTFLDGDESLVVMSPDAGGVKRAERFRASLGARLGRELPLALMEKSRGKGVLKIGRLVGEVRDSTVVIVDDLISTGRTLVGAARACKEAGARQVVAAAAHGVFSAEAEEVLAAEELERILVTDSIQPFRLSSDLVHRKVEVLGASAIFASAVRGLHADDSILGLRDA
jgi:ribose-phosphate pyrophosphokinase